MDNLLWWPKYTGVEQVRIKANISGVKHQSIGSHLTTTYSCVGDFLDNCMGNLLLTGPNCLMIKSAVLSYSVCPFPVVYPQLINIKCEEQVEEHTFCVSIIAGYQQKFW